MANKLFSFKILEQICTVPGTTFMASQRIDQPEDEHTVSVRKQQLYRVIQKDGLNFVHLYFLN
jgi:hypothetical protein